MSSALRFLRYLRLSPAVLRLLLRLGWTLAGIGLAKRRALRVYEETLRREGLPEPFIAELITDYDLRLGEFLRGAWSRPPGRSVDMRNDAALGAHR